MTGSEGRFVISIQPLSPAMQPDRPCWLGSHERQLAQAEAEHTRQLGAARARADAEAVQWRSWHAEALEAERAGARRAQEEAQAAMARVMRAERERAVASACPG